jgi:hypothetical protein
MLLGIILHYDILLGTPAYCTARFTIGSTVPAYLSLRTWAARFWCFGLRKHSCCLLKPPVVKKSWRKNGHKPPPPQKKKCMSTALCAGPLAGKRSRGWAGEGWPCSVCKYLLSPFWPICERNITAFQVRYSTVRVFSHRRVVYFWPGLVMYVFGCPLARSELCDNR